MIDNATLIANHHRLPALREEITHLDTRISELTHRRKDLDTYATALAEIDLIHDGTAITITGFGANTYRATDRHNGRRAQVYENANQPGIWRVRIDYQDPNTLSYPRGWSSGKVHAAADTTSEAAATRIALNWVAHGTYPGLDRADLPEGMTTPTNTTPTVS